MNLFEIVKYGVSCRDAAERYGVEVNRYGMALCPFHNDRHPSLYVADDHYYIRFRADSEASSKAIYEAYTRWCDDNAQKPMSANRVSSELAQNEQLYNVEATNNVHVGGKRVRGFMGIEVVNPLLY